LLSGRITPVPSAIAFVTHAALMNGTYEPDAGPVNHRLPLRNGVSLRRWRSYLAGAVSFSPGDMTVAQVLPAESGSSGVP
jgi:hypothetical protein